MAPGTRERLLDAALQLTREGGYAAASVAAIARGAGVTPSALYRHWPSKAALYAELVARVCARELAAMEAAAAGPGAAVARLDALLDGFAARALAAPRLAWTLIAEPVDPLVEVERLAYRRAYRGVVAGLLREAVAAGEIAEQDPDVVAAALVGALGEALVGPLAGPGPDVAAELRAFAGRAVGLRVPGTAHIAD